MWFPFRMFFYSITDRKYFIILYVPVLQTRHTTVYIMCNFHCQERDYLPLVHGMRLQLHDQTECQELMSVKLPHIKGERFRCSDFVFTVSMFVSITDIGDIATFSRQTKL